jgi:hypothetical protein
MLRLDDDHVKCNVKLRLGTLNNLTDTPNCPVCQEQNAMEKDPWHFLSCNVIISNEGRARHNKLGHSIVKHSRMSGVEGHFEPTHLDQQSKLRPDLLLYTHPTMTVSDIVISNPAAPSHCAAASKESLRITNQAAIKKQSKYKQLTKNLQADFKALHAKSLVECTNKQNNSLNALHVLLR